MNMHELLSLARAHTGGTANKSWGRAAVAHGGQVCRTSKLQRGCGGPWCDCLASHQRLVVAVVCWAGTVSRTRGEPRTVKPRVGVAHRPSPRFGSARVDPRANGTAGDDRGKESAGDLPSSNELRQVKSHLQDEKLWQHRENIVRRSWRVEKGGMNEESLISFRIKTYLVSFYFCIHLDIPKSLRERN